MQTNEIALTDIKVGDIFYVDINSTYYFLQVIHIEQTTESKDKFGYFLVVFNKTFKTLPVSIDELDLQKIYQPKYIWKKTTLYAGIWNAEPHIEFRKDMMYYDLKDKYKVVYFGNSAVSRSFDPEIVMYNSSSSSYVEYNDADIQITHQPLALQVILWGLEQEEKGKTKKKLSIKPQYFKEWLEYIDAENIVRTEKIIAKFESSSNQKGLLTVLKKSVLSLNKLDEKESFITTIEAENVIDKLTEIALSKGLNESEVTQQIEKNRSW